MSIEHISLPKGVGPQAAKLLDAITGAATHEELNRAGGKAEGFVLGLEASKAIKANNFVLASELFSRVLNRFPNHPAAKAGLKKLSKRTSPWTRDARILDNSDILVFQPVVFKSMH